MTQGRPPPPPPRARWPRPRARGGASGCDGAGARAGGRVTGAPGGGPAGGLRGLWVNGVPGVVVLGWRVLDPPPPFMAVFEMLGDPGRWRQGLDNLLGGWLANAPEDVAGWT